MLNIKTWNQFARPTGDDVLTMELKRLRYEESTPLMMALAAAFEARGEVKPGASQLQQIQATRDFLEKLSPAVARQAFVDYVRNVQGLEVDGVVKTEGGQLYEVADADLVIDVLMELQRLAFLSAKEARFFASPSTSSSTPAEPPIVSDAPPIGSGDGGPLSTATPTPNGHESSIALV